MVTVIVILLIISTSKVIIMIIICIIYNQCIIIILYFSLVLFLLPDQYLAISISLFLIYAFRPLLLNQEPGYVSCSEHTDSVYIRLSVCMYGACMREQYVPADATAPTIHSHSAKAVCDPRSS